MPPPRITSQAARNAVRNDPPADDAPGGNQRFLIRQPDGSSAALGHGPDARWTHVRAALPRPINPEVIAAANQRHRFGRAFQAMGVTLTGVAGTLLYRSDQMHQMFSREGAEDFSISPRQGMQVSASVIAAGLGVLSMVVGETLIANADQELNPPAPDILRGMPRPQENNPPETARPDHPG